MLYTKTQHFKDKKEIAESRPYIVCGKNAGIF